MSGLARSYRDLVVWQRAMTVAHAVYQATSRFPASEKFGLVNQMRRAAVSISSNLAEGHARSGAAEFQYFISVTRGSIAELETQVLLSADLEFLDLEIKDDLLARLDEIGKMLRGLDRALQQRRSESSRQR